MARVAASESISGSSRAQHLRKLLRDAERGSLPLPQEEVQEIRDELELLTWTPPNWLAPVYATFWEIRITKAHDSPINHQDLQAWQMVRRLNMDNWALDLIIGWDRAYYEGTRKQA